MGSRRRWAVLVLAVLVLGGAGATAWWYVSRTPAPSSPPVAATEQATLPPSDKPSIAVLPFTNMSGDPQQEYFADGITEDLITDLSKLSGLLVIARNSTFPYKSQSPDVRHVGRDLGVRYVLEGSIRRAGEQVRINAQLIDATTGGHLWAGRAPEAVPILERTMRLDPHYPADRLSSLGMAYFGMEQFDTAVTFYERAITRNPTLAHWVLAAAYAHLGRTQEAADTLRTYQRVRGGRTLSNLNTLKRWYPYKNPRDWERLATGLRQAGIWGSHLEHIARNLHRMSCAEKHLLQATTQERMLPHEEERLRAVKMIENAIANVRLDASDGMLTTEEGTLLETFQQDFAALQHLSRDVVSRVPLAKTPAETVAARELSAGKGQRAVDKTDAAWAQLAEHIGTPYVTLHSPTGAPCQPSESSVGRKQAR